MSKQDVRRNKAAAVLINAARGKKTSVNKIRAAQAVLKESQKFADVSGRHAGQENRPWWKKLLAPWLIDKRPVPRLNEGLTMADYTETIVRRINTNRGYQIMHYTMAACGARIFRRALTPNGDYIGSPKDAIALCVKRGIIPMKRTPTSNVCSIGFSPLKRRWFGWSHRAIAGFRPGEVARKGNCMGIKAGSICKDWNDARRWAERMAESVS